MAATLLLRAAPAIVKGAKLAYRHSEKIGVAAALVRRVAAPEHAQGAGAELSQPTRMKKVRHRIHQAAGGVEKAAATTATVKQLRSAITGRGSQRSGPSNGASPAPSQSSGSRSQRAA